VTGWLSNTFFKYLVILGCLIFGFNSCPAPAQAPDRCRHVWGFIDKHGNFTIRPKHTIGKFSEGLAWRWVSGDRFFPITYKVIDKRGHIRFKIDVLSRPSDFHCGLAAIQNKDNKYGYVNKKGEIAIPCQFTKVGEFSRGLAEVIASKELKRCTIDTRGRIISERPWSPEPHTFWPYGTAIHDRNGKMTFVENGVVLDHMRLSHSSEGLSWAKIYATPYTDPVVGFVDSDNRIAFILGPEIEEAGDFHEGLAPVLVKQKGSDALGRPVFHQIGFINRWGKLVIPAKYSVESLEWIYFSEGIARISLDGYRNCYIDKKDRLLGQFPEGDDFSNGQAAVEAFIDDKGNVIDAADTSHEHQTQLSYEVALLKLLKTKLAHTKSPNLIEFTVTPGEHGLLDVAIEHGSGDAGFDEMVRVMAQGIERPRAGPSIFRRSPATFKLLNGELSVGFPGRARGHLKTLPTLPPGTPIPDSE
jgi:hypothetical protein